LRIRPGRNLRLNVLILCLTGILVLSISAPVAAKNTSTISIDISPLTLTVTEFVRVSGNITPGVAGATVTITYTRPDGTMLSRNTTTSLISTYSDSYSPDLVGKWMVSASWSGNGDYFGASSASASFVVNALPSGMSSITCFTDYSSAVIGTSISISGKVIPTQTASITIEISSDGGNSWNLLTTVTSASDGTYRYPWTPSSSGSYLLRGRWQGDSNHAGATSNPVSVFVRGLPPDFQFSITPNPLSIQQGTSASVTLTITSENGFSSPVNLTATNLPTGMKVSFSQNPVILQSGGTVTATVTMTVSTSVQQGSYTVTFSANGGGIAKQVSLTIAITAQCIIATAAFGSAMAPEVQLLREFRDNQVEHTFAGASFMQVFNAWYYSFSPSVANYIAQNDARRAVTRVMLYPLIDILRIGSGAYSVMNFAPEIAILVSGIMVSLMIGAVYVTLPVFVLRLATGRKLRVKDQLAVARLLMGWNLCVIGIFAVSEALSSPIIMMLASSMVVLTCVAAGGLLPALTIPKRLRYWRLSPRTSRL
jgi:hypothetical protein